jgi:vacuolar-type H+-ATPase subunit F/Vma7
LAATRQVFLGEANLATGFSLAGFEVFPDAGVAELERLLGQLMDERTPAFVVIDQTLAASDSKRLAQVRSEGGRILLTQVPPLTVPERMHSAIDDHIQQLLGLDGDAT